MELKKDIKKIVKLVNLLNKENIKYNLVEEYNQIRFELFLENSHDTQGDYIVIDTDGVLHMNLLSFIKFKTVKAYLRIK